MAFLLQFFIILCTFLVYSADCVSVQNSGDLRLPEPFLAVFCNEYYQRNSHTRKLACVICKGFDPSCFIKTTTTTTSTTTPTTTSSSTTTARPTSTNSTTTTAAPSTRNEDEE